MGSIQGGNVLARLLINYAVVGLDKKEQGG